MEDIKKPLVLNPQRTIMHTLLSDIKYLYTKKMEAPQFIARVLVITLIMLNVVVFLTHSARTIFYPYPVNFSEGQTLGLSILLQQKGNYFFDINDLPFMHGAYPPVYPLIVLFFINIFGVTLTIGRIISFLSTIFIFTFGIGLPTLPIFLKFLLKVKKVDLEASDSP